MNLLRIPYTLLMVAIVLLVSATRQGVAVVSSAAHDTAAYISTNSLFWRKRRRRDFTSSNGDAVPLSKVFATSGGGGAGGGFGKKKGGGFGSTNAATKTASKTKKSPSNATTLTATNKKKKKKKSDLLTEVMETSTTATFKVAELSTENKEKINSPKLDRFGLPIPTANDLFPPLPPDTELIPVSYDATTTSGTPLIKVKEALQNHLTLNLNALFDDHGIGLNDNADGKRMKLHLLHKSPPVLAIDNFFTSEECQECINLATSADQQQTMRVDSATFSPYAQSKRTSTTWFCYYKQVPTLLAKARRLLGVPLEHMEEPQVVRYRTGEEFSWHYDEVPAVQLSNGGQRLATLLVYLNTLDTNRGGGTVFRDLKSCTGDQLTMRPTMGSALLFFPAYADGRPDDRTLHKGEVALDTKMIAQMWIHEGVYSPVVPSGNSHDDAREVIRAKELELGYR